MGEITCANSVAFLMLRVCNLKASVHRFYCRLAIIAQMRSCETRNIQVGASFSAYGKRQFLKANINFSKLILPILSLFHFLPFESFFFPFFFCVCEVLCYICFSILSKLSNDSMKFKFAN